MNMNLSTSLVHIQIDTSSRRFLATTDVLAILSHRRNNLCRCSSHNNNNSLIYTIDSKQHTIHFHVDDIVASHVSSLANDKFADWLDSMYHHYGKVKQTPSHFHHYLAMQFDFSHCCQVRIHMKDYIESLLNTFPVQFTPKDSIPIPAPTDLHATGTSPKLPPKDAEIFHTFVTKALFPCKRARPDIQLAVATLCT